MKPAALPLLLVAALTLPAVAQTAPAPGPAAQPWPANNAEATREQLLAKAKFLQANLRNLAGSAIINANLLQKRLDDVVIQLDHNELQLSETRARLTATVTKLRELTDQGTSLAREDRVLAQLQIVATVADKAAERVQQQVAASVASNADAEATVAHAAEIHAKVEERREAVAASVGGGILPALNRQIVELSLQEDVLAEMQRALQRKRDTLQHAQDISAEIIDVATNLSARFHTGLAGD